MGQDHVWSKEEKDRRQVARAQLITVMLESVRDST
jgi:hypothetical protein